VPPQDKLPTETTGTGTFFALKAPKS